MEMSPLSFSDRTYRFASTEVGFNDILLQIPIEIMGFQLTTQNDFDLEKWLPSSNSGIYRGFLKFGITDVVILVVTQPSRPAKRSFQVSGGGPFEGLVFCGKLCDGTRSFDPGKLGDFVVFFFTLSCIHIGPGYV